MKQTHIKAILLAATCTTFLSARATSDANKTVAPPASTSESSPTAPETSASQASLEAVHSAHRKKPLLQQGDLPNFHEVYPYLYRGGEPTEKGLHDLKEKGVGTIIDLRAKTEQEIAEAKIAKTLGFKYINLPMTSEAPTKVQIDKVIAAIDDAKKKYNNGEQTSAVFLHCAHGSDRTGCMVGIWRVSRDGWDYETTYKEMRKYYFTPKFVKLSGAVLKASQNN